MNQLAMTINNNIITMERLELLSILQEAVSLGAQKGLIESAKLKPYLTKSEAYKLYGRRHVERWLKEGLIKQIKDGDSNYSVRINRLQIESVASVCNRVSFYQNHREK